MRSKREAPDPGHRKTGRRARPGRGTLLTIATLLLGSALIRVGEDAGRAFAMQAGGLEQETAPAGEEQAQTEDCVLPPDVAALLEAFKTREARIEDRETAIRARMHALQLADREITEKLVALTEAEEALRQTIALADTAAEDDLARLTSVYESMKPKEAAALFEAMDPTFSAGFLGRMAPGSAAQIMAGLSPNTAYTISAILAGRNANVPTE